VGGVDSFAMPNETENARSDPREPSAPAVAMLSRNQDIGALVLTRLEEGVGVR